MLFARSASGALLESVVRAQRERSFISSRRAGRLEVRHQARDIDETKRDENRRGSSFADATDSR
eukprot:5863810-Prymnesium_polylepis.1